MYDIVYHIGYDDRPDIDRYICVEIGPICFHIGSYVGPDTTLLIHESVLPYLYGSFKWYARWYWPYCRQWKRFPRLDVLVLCHIDLIWHACKVTGV